MLFSDPYPRVVVVPAGARRGRSPLRLALLILLVLAALVHVANLFRHTPERTAPAHVTHGHQHAARFVRS